MQALDRAGNLGLGIGLHLNLTEGAPLSPSSAVPSLVDKHGQMLGKFGLRDALQAGRVQDTHLQTELSAQLSWYRSVVPAGQTHWHIDGHQVYLSGKVILLPTLALARPRSALGRPAPIRPATGQLSRSLSPRTRGPSCPAMRSAWYGSAQGSLSQARRSPAPAVHGRRHRVGQGLAPSVRLSRTLAVRTG